MATAAAGGFDGARQLIDSYKLDINGVVVDVKISSTEQEAVPIYAISFLNISDATLRILNKLREEFLSKVVIGAIQLGEETGVDIRQRFEGEISILIKKYFPGIDLDTTNLLVSHVMQQNVGLGNIEILLRDKNLEEIALVALSVFLSTTVKSSSESWCELTREAASLTLSFKLFSLFFWAVNNTKVATVAKATTAKTTTEKIVSFF